MAIAGMELNKIVWQTAYGSDNFRVVLADSGGDTIVILEAQSVNSEGATIWGEIHHGDDFISCFGAAALCLHYDRCVQAGVDPGPAPDVWGTV